ncbi:MAG TPA: YIP1 family protein [Anaeromyxobacteraceae bacterium]|nr:YIP1 family protein [Anaeromyxobacteraceae bacterium]
MIARCARCQGTFQADRFGVQTCPHCGGQVLLSDPNAPQGAGDAGGQAGGPPPPSAPPAPAPGSAPAGGAPSSSPPPPGFGPPPAGFGPPPGGYGPSPGGYGAPPPWGGGGRPTGGPGQPSPFADRARLGFFRAYFETWKRAAIEPTEFFRSVRIDQTGSAILFGVIASTLGGWAQSFWASLTAASTRAQMLELSSKIPPQWAGFAKAFSEYAEHATSTTSLVSQALFAPLAAVVGIFVSAAIFHALLLLVRGANRGFDATLTVVGYAWGISLLQLIPECGALVVPIWMAVVLITGFAEAHRCGTGKGAAAVLLPMALLCVCLCGAIALAFGASGLGALTGQMPKGVQL